VATPTTNAPVACTYSDRDQTDIPTPPREGGPKLRGRALADGGGQLAEIDGQPLFALTGTVPAWRDLPAAAQAAANKCANIIVEFNDAQFATSMAGIETMNDVISTDVIQDPEFKNAMKVWSACMARNGYTSSDADALALQELTAIGLRAAPGSGPGTTVPGSGPTAVQNKAQIATAVTDADCTQASDLAGIYFAVQASYEQQVVDANQQALNAAVRQYKAAYAKELSKLPALLRTTSATPELPQGPGRPGGSSHASGPSGPSPARS
jgi:hypothetical protein